MAQAMQNMGIQRKEGIDMFTGGMGVPPVGGKKTPPPSKEKELTPKQKKALIAKLEAGEIGKKELKELAPAERNFVIALVKAKGKELKAEQQASTKEFYKDAIASAGKYKGRTEGAARASTKGCRGTISQETRDQAGRPRSEGMGSHRGSP